MTRLALLIFAIAAMTCVGVSDAEAQCRGGGGYGGGYYGGGGSYYGGQSYYRPSTRINYGNVYRGASYRPYYGGGFSTVRSSSFGRSNFRGSSFNSGFGRSGFNNFGRSGLSVGIRF